MNLPKRIYFWVDERLEMHEILKKDVLDKPIPKGLNLSYCTTQRLQGALDNIKTLEGLLPMCANCKNIRDDDGYWQQVEVYIRQHSKAKCSHSICPKCARQLYPYLFNEENT